MCLQRNDGMPIMAVSEFVTRFGQTGLSNGVGQM
jgi:hypothetical protein